MQPKSPDSGDELKTQAMTQADDRAADALATDDELPVGAAVGPYRIRRLLGAGGMGRVYLAEQLEPIRREVALKLLARSRLSGMQVTWFEIERQVLAQMRHPAIAQVYDAGTTADGRPYFAMELIDGETITDYCRARRLDLRQRLELFVRVCQGVQHAHQKGIVHRDLKPGNILVALVDGDALPKIIDFGIATAAHRALSSGLSEARDRAGTPEYMSPEQSGLVELDVDTRSDVYSLGVVLYELLTGTRPDAATNTDAAARAQASTLVPPSAQLASLQAGQAGELRSEGLDPNLLRSVFKRDLDWVVLKAMRFDRAERYASAAELGDELQRFLEHRPLLAVPQTPGYAMGKFIRRHRLAFTAGGAVTLALVLGIVSSLWALMQAREQRTLADARSAELSQVVAFQQRMLEDLDLEAMGATLQRSLVQRHATALATDGLEAEVLESSSRGFEQSLARAGSADAARELLNTRVLQPALQGIERDFADQPLLAAALLASLGEVQFNLGLFAESIDRHGTALDIRERELGPRHPDTIASRYSLGTALTRNDRLDDARRELEQALLDARAALAPDAEVIVSIEQQLAQSLTDAGRLAEARSMQEALITRAELQHGAEHPRTLAIRNNLGITLIKLGEYRLALEQYEQIVPLRERLLGENHRDTMAAMSNLAALRGNLGDFEGALALQERLQTLLTERMGAEHPSTLSQANNAATTLFRMGRSDEARQRMERVVELRRKVMGDMHSETLRAMHNLASTLNLTGESERSLALMREVHALRSRSLGAEHPDTLSTRANFASVLRRLGRNDEALEESQAMLETRRRVLGEAHPDTLGSMEEVSELLADTGKPQAAEQIARQALELAIERHQDDGHPAVRRAAINHFAKLHGVGDVAAADAVYQRHLASLAEADEDSLSPQDRGLQKRLRDRMESIGVAR